MRTLIIGAGLAGYTLARHLAKRMKGNAITLVAADSGRYYYKPDLSTALGRHQTPSDLAEASAEHMAEALGLNIHPDLTVDRVDREAKRVQAGSRRFPYDQLVLAVGARPRALPATGDGVEAIHRVNNLADYERFREALPGARHVAIVGAGLIGCEFANDLAAGGYQVTVIAPGCTPLPQLLPPAAGQALARGLEAAGVCLCLGRHVRTVEGGPGRFTIVLDDGAAVTADRVLSAIGLTPNTELAAEAGLPIRHGIVADRTLQVAENVYALGDCMELEGLVLPFVAPLKACAKALARTLAGEPTRVRYPAMPITVKTPAHPVVVSPAYGREGTWQIEADDEAGVRAEHRAPDGTLNGFALTGSHVRDRQTLVRQVPPLLR